MMAVERGNDDDEVPDFWRSPGEKKKKCKIKQ